MKTRVCIFAAETLLHWSGYYVRAFRQCCDAQVIGPANNPDGHDFPDWDRVAPYVIENDIHSTATAVSERFSLLPDGWEPELLVVIQSGDVAIEGIDSARCPTVYLSIDSWHDSSEFEHAYVYDFVFLAQEALCKYMRRMGCCRVFWLPLACDPEHHYAIGGTGEAEFDIAFVGSTHFYVNQQRARRLSVLEEQFSLGLFFGLGTVEMAEAYGKSRLIFNASIACDVNMRVFEALATGVPLVTNREAEANGLFTLFEDGVHLITYDDDDIVSQVRHYLDAPAEAAAIGAAGRREVLAHHTYVHRVEQLFETLSEHEVRFGNDAPARRRGTALRDCLPYGTTRVLDIGLGLQSSRIALSHQGVTYVAGIALDAESAHRRVNSYDDLWFQLAIPAPSGDFDAVVWSERMNTGQGVGSILRYARPWLIVGGRVLFTTTDEALDEAAGGRTKLAVIAWVEAEGCKLVQWYPPESARAFHVFVVTPVSTTMAALNGDLYGEFPINGTNSEPWKDVSSAPVSDLPDAEGP